MVNSFLSFVQCYMNYFIAYLFLNGFFPKRTNKFAFTAGCIGVCALLLSTVNSFKQPLWNSIACVTIMIALLLVTFKGKFLKLCFVGVVMMAIISACELIAISAISAVIKLSVGQAAEISLQQVSLSFTSTGFFFVITVLAKLLFIKCKKVKSMQESSFPLALLSLPILSILVVYFIVQTSAQSTFNPSMLFQGFLILFSLLVMNIVVFASDNDARKKYQYKAEIAEMQAQCEMKQTLIAQQDQSFRETNHLIHDFKHQLLNLQMQLNETHTSEESRKIADNITAAIENLPEQTRYEQVTSSALRCILIHTDNECKRLGINFNTAIEFSDFEFLSYQDICTIFANALENAVTACEERVKQKLAATIAVKMRSHNNMVFVNICNDKMNAIIKEGDMICTTKQDKRRHGIGLANIKRTVEKYGGEIKVTYTDTTFTMDLVFWMNQK